MHRLPHERLHRRDLVVAGAPLGRGLAHHVTADRGVPDVGAHVDGDAALERVQVLPERPARPAEARPERLDRHALHARQHVREPGGVVGLGGREREAAVAGEDGGDAVPRRRRRRRLPVQLRIVVRMDVDESRRDDAPVGVDGARCALRHPADADDAAVAHGDVGAVGRHARAVDDPAAAYDEVEAHASPPSSP